MWGFLIRWTTKEIQYLELNAESGAQAIARALNRSKNSVKVQASRRAVSLRPRTVCPKCGKTTFKPLNTRSGWCVECMKEQRLAELQIQLKAMQAEHKREQRNNQARQRVYSAKSRNKNETNRKQAS